MKKNFYLLLIALVSLYSCQKNDIVNEYKTISIDTEYQTNKKSVSIDNVTTFNDLIRFKSEEDFRNAYSTLSRAQTEEINSFNSLFVNTDKEFVKTLSFEELEKNSLLLDEKSAEFNFSEESIFKKFEKALNFISLRLVLSSKHEDWLNTDSEPNWELNPLDHHIPLPSLQTFYNKYSEIMIGNTLYKSYSNGITLIVKDVDYKQILDIRNNYDNISKYKNVEVYGYDNRNNKEKNENGTTGKTNLYGCEMNKRQWDHWYYLNCPTFNATCLKRPRIAVGIADGGLWDVMFSKISHYVISCTTLFFISPSFFV